MVVGNCGLRNVAEDANGVTGEDCIAESSVSACLVGAAIGPVLSFGCEFVCGAT